MAVKNIAVTDTLETFRTTFNELCAQDFGDKAALSGAISATNLVDAMNETISIATSTAGWTMEDASSTQQIVGGGQIARFLGASNQINAVVSSPDTLTMSLNNVVEVTTSVKAGTLTIAAGSLTDTSGTISLGDENLTTTGNIAGTDLTGTNVEVTTLKGNNLQSKSGNIVTVPSGQTLKVEGSFQVDSVPTFASSILFEGSSADDHETTITVTNPTADRTITIPDETGTVITTGSIDAVTETMMANDAIGSAELKSVVSLIIYNSSGVAQKTIYGAGA